MYVKKKMSVCSHYGFRGLLASRKCFQRLLDPSRSSPWNGSTPTLVNNPGNHQNCGRRNADGGIGEGIPQ